MDATRAFMSVSGYRHQTQDQTPVLTGYEGTRLAFCSPGVGPRRRRSKPQTKDKVPDIPHTAPESATAPPAPRPVCGPPVPVLAPLMSTPSIPEVSALVSGLASCPVDDLPHSLPSKSDQFSTEPQVVGPSMHRRRSARRRRAQHGSCSETPSKEPLSSTTSESSTPAMSAQEARERAEFEVIDNLLTVLKAKLKVSLHDPATSCAIVQRMEDLILSRPWLREIGAAIMHLASLRDLRAMLGAKIPSPVQVVVPPGPEPASTCPAPASELNSAVPAPVTVPAPASELNSAVPAPLTVPAPASELNSAVPAPLTVPAPAPEPDSAVPAPLTVPAPAPEPDSAAPVPGHVDVDAATSAPVPGRVNTTTSVQPPGRVDTVSGDSALALPVPVAALRSATARLVPVPVAAPRSATARLVPVPVAAPRSATARLVPVPVAAPRSATARRVPVPVSVPAPRSASVSPVSLSCFYVPRSSSRL
ncbi:hypothetical protein EXN66_Car009178 [Channa argus]|uniref:Uncharacterized protein n=1 Tax=Channa argus TaxID=215402 RepID=A0A6G1PTB2_CHAAH|nr:hypothetical protein EXN66_Car009178 [Channa argus]